MVNGKKTKPFLLQQRENLFYRLPFLRSINPPKPSNKSVAGSGTVYPDSIV
jgi:hypothetical protein